MLQRAIAHYRFPLFKRLADESPFEWTFYCAPHDQTFSTGLPAPDLHELAVRPITNRRLFGPFIYQSGVALRGQDAFVLDLGWTLLSTPRYLLEAKARGIGVIGWSKGIPQKPGARENPAKRLYQQFILGLCDLLVVYGKISKEYFLAQGFPAERIYIAQNTLDTRRIARDLPQATAQKHSLLESLPVKGRFVFGYMGGLVRRKRVDAIIEAFTRVRSQGVDAVLVVAGGGSAEEAVKAAAAASPFRSDIFLVGRVPVGAEGGYFQLFDAYLSFAEGGLGILEAMAHGKVVISTPEKYPETELLTDGETALLADGFSPEALASRMLAAASNRYDLIALGRNARERVLCEATLENMADSLNAAVKAAIARHRPAGVPGIVIK